ncbi:protein MICRORCHIDIA 2-like [Salvia hispanica]|uniref:protein MICRORCHIDIA 2-like n=1 Tax=Salvia hispanica TaxID=49212 RepID=UPI0020093252|nr:protein MICRORCHIDIA 2-like [Salvia hispanica]
MPPKQIPASVEVVDLDSSDDDGVAATTANRKPAYSDKLQAKPPSKGAAQLASVVNNQSIEDRSFWRAGAYEIGTTKSSLLQGDLEHARVHPKFLHSNATSHKWAFGAIAELLDNAVDEIENGATFVNVDQIYNSKDNSPALLFQDDGGGMDPEGMRKCMSLGYSSKTSNTTIGQYGNGFKTSTMRLGADVIVFSRSNRSGRATQSIGLLSYTFLRRTGQDDVIVPMIDFDISDNWAKPIIYSSMDDWSSNLKTILEWSPFASKDDLMQQFGNLGSHGTKVIIYNLWMNDEGIYELNFDDDQEDITLRDEAKQGGTGNTTKTFKRVLELQSHISYCIRFSLRAYASILYLKKFTNFRIILRGKPVEQFSIADDLKHAMTVVYNPQVVQGLKEVTVKTVIGFIKEAPALGVCGFNIYHKNRLIRPYWKVTPDGSSKGHGVVGVLEANFIEPAHDKQDFERSTLFIKLEARLKQMVSEYWKGHCHFLGHQPDGTRKSNDASGNTYRTSFNHTTATAGSEACAQPENPLNPAALEAMAEENDQLSRRCDEYRKKQAEMTRTIEELEKELEETRNKCARVSSYLRIQRMET